MNKRIAEIVKQLDDRNVIVLINRVAKKHYEVYQNFEIVKRYKQRRSCNKYIERLSKSLKRD